MLKRLKLALVAVSILIGATSAGSAQEALQRVLEEKVIKVGVVPGWPRFLVKKPDGDGYEGFLADDLKNFEERMGIKVEYVATNWAGIVAGLQAGAFDVMVGGGITPERAAALAFGKPYAFFNTSALARPDSEAQSLADLDQEGKVLSVVSGTAMHTFARNHVKNAQIAALADSSSAVLDVMQGRADAYIGDSWTNYIRAEERPDELKLVRFEENESEWGGLAFAVRYGDADLLALLDGYVTSMQLQRWYHTLTERYSLPEETPVGPR
jgi:polar amino acid transport system substrate-binding protein